MTFSHSLWASFAFASVVEILSWWIKEVTRFRRRECRWPAEGKGIEREEREKVRWERREREREGEVETGDENGKCWLTSSTQFPESQSFHCSKMFDVEDVCSFGKWTCQLLSPRSRALHPSPLLSNHFSYISHPSTLPFLYISTQPISTQPNSTMAFRQTVCTLAPRALRTSSLMSPLRASASIPSTFKITNSLLTRGYASGGALNAEQIQQRINDVLKSFEKVDVNKVSQTEEAEQKV